jgi:hypothetical protein
LTPDTEEQVRSLAERKGGVSAPPRSGPPLEGKLFPRPSVKQAIAFPSSNLSSKGKLSLLGDVKEPLKGLF